MSDRKPQLKELALALRDLTWSDIESMALQLDMPYIKLQQIKEQNSELSACLHSAMHSWLNSDPKASWTRIIKALNDTEKGVLAEEIGQKYCQPLEPLHATTAILAESTTNLPLMNSGTAPSPAPPTVEDPFSPISLTASEYSFPLPPRVYISDSSEVSSPTTPHAPSTASSVDRRPPAHRTHVWQQQPPDETERAGSSTLRHHRRYRHETTSLEERIS